MTVTDKLFTVAGELVDVVNISIEENKCATYNLTIDQAHTYYVTVDNTSILVHNSCKGRVDGNKIQDHHIISNKNNATKNHPLVESAGGPKVLESRSNKILLPTDAANNPTRSIHKGRHTQSVSDDISKKMNKAYVEGMSKVDANESLSRIQAEARKKLRNGETRLNKNYRK